jgi:hypothetical protein
MYRFRTKVIKCVSREIVKVKVKVLLPFPHASHPQGLPKNIEATRVSIKYSAST